MISAKYIAKSFKINHLASSYYTACEAFLQPLSKHGCLKTHFLVLRGVFKLHKQLCLFSYFITLAL